MQDPCTPTFLLPVIWNFQNTSFAFLLLNLILKFFVLFDTVVNRIVLLISFLVCSYLVYRQVCADRCYALCLFLFLKLKKIFIYFIFNFLAALHGMWDLSTLTRD